jgi:hypothetical protein
LYDNSIALFIVLHIICDFLDYAAELVSECKGNGLSCDRMRCGGTEVRPAKVFVEVYNVQI